VTRAGIRWSLAGGKKKDVLGRILAGEIEGTLFVPQPTNSKGANAGLHFSTTPKGTLCVDDGAKTALRERGKSLLPPGIAQCDGVFQRGDIVRICDLNGTEFARGISRFSAAEISARTLSRVEVVHRDDLVIL